MKKRIAGIAALTAATAVALGLPTVGAPAAPDTRGPKCADIEIQSAGYAGTLGGAANVQGVLITAAPSCAGGDYTMSVVYTDTNGNPQTKTLTIVGDGITSEFSFVIGIGENAPSTVCLYGTSQPNSKSKSIADTAPDSACDDPTTVNNLALGSGGASGMG
jgi:hypothetical protein